MKKIFLALLAIALSFNAFSQTASALIDSAQAFNDAYIYNNTTRIVTPKKIHDAIDKVISVLVHFDENWTPGTVLTAGTFVIIDSLSTRKYRIDVDTNKIHTSAYNNAQYAVANNVWLTDGTSPSDAQFNVASGPLDFREGSIPLAYIGGFSGAGKIAFGYNTYSYGDRSITIGKSIANYGDSSFVVGANFTNSTRKRAVVFVDWMNSLHMNLDSASGSAPNVVGVDENGDWHRYAAPSGVSSDDLDAVTARGGTSTNNIVVSGDNKSSVVRSTTTFGEAGAGTDAGKGYLYVAKADGNYVNILPDSLVGSQNLFAPNESGVIAIKKYKEYVATIFPQSGTDPIVQVINNELGTVTWTASGSPQSYSATCTNCFTVGKTVVTYTAGEILGNPPVFSWFPDSGEDDTVLTYITDSITGGPCDECVSWFQVIIRVYK